MADPRVSRRTLLLAAGVSALAAAGITALLVNIFQHQQEARNPFQYDAYRRTVDQQRTRYGGSEALPHTPTGADPRSIVAESRLEEDPRLKIMWSGYAFSTDFREERGHAYMLDDQNYTERQHFSKQPGIYHSPS